MLHDGKRLRAQFIVGCDGLRCLSARGLGLGVSDQAQLVNGLV